MLRRVFWTSRCQFRSLPLKARAVAAPAPARRAIRRRPLLRRKPTRAHRRTPRRRLTTQHSAMPAKPLCRKSANALRRPKKNSRNLQKAQAAREEAEAKAKGDFESLAKTAQDERDALKAELAKRDHDDLKRTVATKHKLSSELAARLVGETEAELEADAKALAKLVGAREAPDTEAGAGARGASSPSDRPSRRNRLRGKRPRPTRSTVDRKSPGPIGPSAIPGGPIQEA
jgi:hypothetical protein